MPQGTIYFYVYQGEFSVFSDDFGKSWKKMIMPLNTVGGPQTPVFDSLTGMMTCNFNSTIFRTALGSTLIWDQIDAPLGDVTSIIHNKGTLVSFTGHDGTGGYAQGRIWHSIDNGITWIKDTFVIDDHAKEKSTFYTCALDSSLNIITSSSGYIVRSPNGAV